MFGRKNPSFLANIAARLAERGFITFAPHNLYRGEDRYRWLSRKANGVKASLFSFILGQHGQILRWLGTLPMVDPQRIAFYGLSYGGKSAMRIPPLVKNYCLSICSGDFNDWVWKCASTLSPYSYVRMPEYEIFEFDLGSTFNYAEIAALIAMAVYALLVWGIVSVIPIVMDRPHARTTTRATVEQTPGGPGNEHTKGVVQTAHR